MFITSPSCSEIIRSQERIWKWNKKCPVSLILHRTYTLFLWHVTRDATRLTVRGKMGLWLSGAVLQFSPGLTWSPVPAHCDRRWKVGKSQSQLFIDCSVESRLIHTHTPNIFIISAWKQISNTTKLIYHSCTVWKFSWKKYIWKKHLSPYTYFCCNFFLLRNLLGKTTKHLLASTIFPRTI